MRHDPLAEPAELVPRVYAYVAYRIGDGPDAEDITSEAFERAIRYRDSFDLRKGEPLSWLIGIARNVIADTRSLPEAELRDSPGFDELHEQTQQRVDIARAIAELEQRDQELVALRYGADLTAKQIASVMEMKTNAVEVALHRALGRLRELLEDSAATEARSPRSFVA
jgi:RNA polymerase sigma-70 factor (ECF subfamily)